MFTQLLKITLFTSAWLWLKPRWRGLLGLIGFVLLVSILHSEYLNYVALSGNSRYLVTSYVIKWLLLSVGAAAFILLSGLKRQSGASSADKSGDGPAAADQPAADDGFDFLRDKPHLQSRADKLLDK